MDHQFIVEKVLFIILGSLLVASCNDTARKEDICGLHNGRRLYVELGEHGVLYANNVSFIKHAPRRQISRLYMTNSSHDQCNLELVTCPSCAINLTFKTLDLPHSCGDGGMMMDSPCRCDYVWISEPPYEDISGAPYCGLYTPIVYRSSTRTVSITLFYSQSHQQAFTLEYSAERNRQQLTPQGLNGTAGGILTSPFFPARYPRDLGLEYSITCPMEAHSCRVRVLFSDFQLASISIIEFYDWNGQRLDVSSGARFRPPIVISTGPSLSIRFYANGGTGLGYKAFYSYVIGHLYDKAIQPITDCGGYVENLGGAITMIDMVGQGLKTYDCVWLIRPPKNFLHMKTHMYLKVVTFADMAGNTELIIRQGPTSTLLPLEVLRHPVNQLHPPRMMEHIAPIASGFHVSLRGTFGPTSRVAIAYSAFGYMDCFSGSDFLCQNHRCIQNQLNCDGFDHCGDNSDEPSTCFRDWDLEPRDRKWHMNKANYYFPKIDRYPDLKTATLVFVASSLGLIVIISALIILLYRMGARARQQRELQSRLQTISELLDSQRVDEISVTDDPPVYEAPPGYEDVVKIGFDRERIRGKKWINPFREPRSRSTPSQRSSPIETPGASTDRRNNDSLNPTNRIPESPPPPYITPPGSVLRTFGISRLTRNNFIRTSAPIGSRVERIRRVWHQNSEFSRSFPGPEDINTVHPSTLIDPEALGQYLRNYAASMHVERSDSQPTSSNNAVLNTNRGYDENSRGQEHAGPSNRDQSHLRHQQENCACEGACGCANSKAVTPVDNSETKEIVCPKFTILKLLKTGKSCPQNLNLTTTTVSTMRPVTPDEAHDSRRTSISDTTHHTRSSICDTPDLADEFEIMSEAASLVNQSLSSSTPSFTPVRITKANNITESLFESIKTLETFLANRTTTASHSRHHSVTLFEAPRHRRQISQGSNQPGLFDCVRGWRSTDDTFSN